MKNNRRRTQYDALCGLVALLLLAGCAAPQGSGITPTPPGAQTTPPGAEATHALPPAKVAADPAVRQVTVADTQFGLALLGRLSKDTPSRNVFVSPLSVAGALDMALSGANGPTARSIAATLRLPPTLPVAQVNAANKLLIPSLQNPDPKVQLSVANALWARQGTPFNPQFSQRCREDYGADATALDFAGPGAADTINAWVKANTQGKITQIVQRADLTSATFVLTNAVYFHGSWQDSFDKDATQEAPFRRDTGGPVTVPLMSRLGEYPYTETSQFQAVSLPCGEGRMQMVILLPRPGVTLDTILQSLNAKTWAAAMAAEKPTRLTLFLPRFRVDYGASLTGPLSALGMGAAFAPSADFGPMGLPPGKGGISGVYHKAVMEVSEEGTVAAAATAIGMAGSAVPRPVPEVRVNHPFVCAIQDTATGTLLFVGAIRNPQPLP